MTERELQGISVAKKAEKIIRYFESQGREVVGVTIDGKAIDLPPETSLVLM